MTNTATLFEHDDGRHAVAWGEASPGFTRGEPAWHRVGPVDVSALAALPQPNPTAPRPVGHWETPEGNAEQLAARADRLLRLVRMDAPPALIASARALVQESAARLPRPAAAPEPDDTPLETGEADAR